MGVRFLDFCRYYYVSDVVPDGPTQAGFRIVAQHDRMRWYDPRLRRFEWREMPEDDAEALGLLGGYPKAEADAAVYREWRALGASVAASLLRAGEAARTRDRG
ncbi:MAG: hypothetical protein WKF95_18460 [Rubrobacter sp.]